MHSDQSSDAIFSLNPIEGSYLRPGILAALLLLSVLVVHPTVTLAAGGDILWQVNVGGSCNLTALGNDGTIYANSGFSEGKLYSISPTGQVNWSRNHNGFRCNDAPTITEDGTILADGGEDGTLYAYDSSGNELWRFQTGNRLSNSPALAADGTIYLTNRGGKIYALNQDGTQQWELQFDANNLRPPVVGPQGTIYVTVTTANGSNLFAVNPDGTIQWSRSLDGAVQGIPALNGEGKIIVVGNKSNGTEGILQVLNPDGSLDWKSDLDGTIKRSITVDKNQTIYVPINNGPDQGIVAVFDTGTIKWKYSTSSGVATEPFLGDNGSIYFGTASNWSGAIYSVSSNGTLNWKKNVNGRVRENISMADKGGTIYYDRGYPYRHILAVESSANGIADAPWPSFQRDTMNTGRAEKLCQLQPELKIVPSHLKLNRGSVMVFIDGFKTKDLPVTSLDPSTITVAGAEPEWWFTVPPFFFRSGFVFLKFDRKNFNVNNDRTPGRKWRKTSLPVTGKVPAAGCFETTVDVKIRP